MRLRSLRLGVVTALIAFALPAQTLEQAESLWKARRFQEANDAFRALVARSPKNPDYRVRWGRMYLDHSQPSDARDLFGEALEIKQDHAGALLGLALVAAQNFDHRAAELAPGTRLDIALQFEPDDYSAARGYANWQAIVRDVRAPVGQTSVCAGL